MMTFKDLLKETPAFRFVFDHLPIQSSLGEKALYTFPFLTDSNEITKEIQNVSDLKDWFYEDKNREKVCEWIHEIKDISGIIKRLKNNETLDDIDFFEIKKNAIYLEKINNYLSQNHFRLFELKQLKPVIHHLDPENSEVPHFYIYSAYDPKLQQLRKELEINANTNLRDQIYQQITEIEDQIRKQLSVSLRQYVSHLDYNLHQIGIFDLWIAKAKLAKLWNCCKPEVSNHHTSYKHLFHPIVKDRLSKENKKFQALNIDLYQNPTLITGANMSGKTIFLKTIAYTQYMFQFGMFVPAREASICPVEEIFFSIGDQSSELTGLSSFAYEILTIDHIIQESKKGKKILILVDELARTTNPVEGTLLVNAFIEMINKNPNFCIITTHYSGIKAQCRRLRVKGLQIDQIKEKIEPQHLEQFMDYSLIEIQKEEVPHEALKIAQLLGVDSEYLKLAETFSKE